jgi:CBS domain-containing protein
MRIKTVLRPLTVTVEAEEPLSTAACLMAVNNIDAVAVTGRDRVRIISERDIIRAIGDGVDLAGPVDSYASSELRGVQLDDETRTVVHQMLETGIRYLPVVDQNRVVGTVSLRDLLSMEAWTWLAAGLVGNRPSWGEVAAVEGAAASECGFKRSACQPRDGRPVHACRWDRASVASG